MKVIARRLPGLHFKKSVLNVLTCITILKKKNNVRYFYFVLFLYFVHFFPHHGSGGTGVELFAASLCEYMQHAHVLHNEVYTELIEQLRLKKNMLNFNIIYFNVGFNKSKACYMAVNLVILLPKFWASLR